MSEYGLLTNINGEMSPLYNLPRYFNFSPLNFTINTRQENYSAQSWGIFMNKIVPFSFNITEAVNNNTEILKNKFISIKLKYKITSNNRNDVVTQSIKPDINLLRITDTIPPAINNSISNDIIIQLRLNKHLTLSYEVTPYFILYGT